MNSSSGPAVFWLRDDLRLADNPALLAAIATQAPVLCIYVHDTVSAGLRPLGGAARWWLHQSLMQLAGTLAAIGGRLDVVEGGAASLIAQIVEASAARFVFWNRRYGQGEMALDAQLKARLRGDGVDVASFNSHLLHEPWEVKTQSGTHFRVFSPFWRAAQARGPIALAQPAPQTMQGAAYPLSGPERVTIADLKLLPVKPNWASGLEQAWQPGEAGAHVRLARFMIDGIDNYGTDRNRPDLPGKTSHLSPHLRFGEISPRQIVQAAEFAASREESRRKDVDKFAAEIGWREFSYNLLYHHPELATRNFAARFDAFPWRAVPESEIVAWQKGLTGYPIVDAGMRELWQTGTMHNRVRMVTASFLTKHLMADWRIGEQWFWDTLVDADAASNAASWQWVAGSGADAAPYFRIFNPVLQGERFDPNGDYVRRFVPELARLPTKWLQKPWEAPIDILRAAGVKLGRDYPQPIVEHTLARNRALAAFASLDGKPLQ